MAYKTGIEWTHSFYKDGKMWKGELVYAIPGATFNIVIGCAKVSPACKFCYAEKLDHRWGNDHWGVNAPRQVMSSDYWKKPLSWDKEAAAAGIKRKVFCSSMADVFEDHPTVNAERQKLFELIDQTPNLIWLLLTKRPENILKFIPAKWERNPPQNVWYGTTVESPEYLSRVEELCRVPARLRFVSMEPLLGQVEMENHLGRIIFGNPLFSDRLGVAGKIHWVIAGGESGNKNDVRLSHPYWYYSLRDECGMADVPFFFKQWGEYHTASFIDGDEGAVPWIRMFTNKDNWIEKAETWVRGGRCVDLSGKEMKSDADFETAKYPVVILDYVGKKEAGNLLQGNKYIETPETYYSLW